MFFGGINGLLRFYPEEIQENTQPPTVVITGFSLPRADTSLPQPISQVEKIELSYDDDVFSFEFAGLDYTNPDKNQFAYKLSKKLQSSTGKVESFGS